ncbi:MAG TPA: hypothetical protein VGD61_15355 [Pyrinomonadaceae bacterium]
MYLYDRQAPGSQYAESTTPGNRFGWGAGQFGQAGLPLPTVSAFRFRNFGTTDPENCCTNCTTLDPRTGGRLNLGVGLRGNGALPVRAANGMELAFTISGHRPGVEYDITRTRRNSLWQRVGGVWTRLESFSMGTGDDPPPDVDECLRLSGSNRIFSEDRPGWRNAAPPVSAVTLFTGVNPANVSNVAATELVFRFSFAEWVIARNRAEGVPWTRLQLPPFANGTPRPHIYWHSVTRLIRTPAGDTTGPWVLGPGNVIELGSLSAAIINSAPA